MTEEKREFSSSGATGERWSSKPSPPSIICSISDCCFRRNFCSRLYLPLSARFTTRAKEDSIAAGVHYVVSLTVTLNFSL